MNGTGNRASQTHRVLEYHLGVTGWVLVDMAAAVPVVLAACWASPAYRRVLESGNADPNFSPILTGILYALLFPAVSHVFGLHNPLLRRDRLVMAVRYVCVALLAVTLLALVELMFLYTRVGRHILVFTFLFSSLGLVLLRLALWRLSEETKRRVVVLGPPALREAVEGLVRKTGIPYEVVRPEELECVKSSSRRTEGSDLPLPKEEREQNPSPEAEGMGSPTQMEPPGRRLLRAQTQPPLPGPLLVPEEEREQSAQPQRTGGSKIGAKAEGMGSQTQMEPPGVGCYGALGCLDGALGYCCQCGIHEIVTCNNTDTPREELVRLSNTLLSGLQVTDYASFIERTFFQTPVEQLGPDWFFQLNTSGDYALYRGAKRVADILCAAAGLVFTGPFILLAAIAIKLESHGPAFYSQIRVGQFQRPFTIWKLRSMRDGAEENGVQWACRNDARVTRVGRILRRTRLDEVPQFLNVLRGEMSLVGPRPERPEFVSELAKAIPFYQQRHLLRPGITGWAQINHPYGATQEDALNKLKYDLYYLKHASPLLDTQIVLRTIGALMKGAR